MSVLVFQLLSGPDEVIIGVLASVLPNRRENGYNQAEVLRIGLSALAI